MAVRPRGERGGLQNVLECDSHTLILIRVHPCFIRGRRIFLRSSPLLHRGEADMSVQFEKTIPILRIFDVDKAKEFYIGYLGFTVDWEHHFEENTPAYL